MLQIGDVLRDRYQLQASLGENANRQTWLATDLQHSGGDRVVIKLLTLSPTMQWEECKLLEREARVLQRLQHPRIPVYQDYFMLEPHPGSCYPRFVLVQRYIPGRSLQQVLNEGCHVSEADIMQIATEVLHILTYLHQQNPPVLHRDIKPGNVIWGDDRHIYLVDFGAVQDQAVLEGATFTVVGTYGYVPMEQFGGRAVPASDLYALGATLIHLITGVSPADLPHQEGRILFSDRVSLDLGLVYWIGKLTEPHLSDRLQTAPQALDALEHRHNLSLPTLTAKPTGSRIAIKKSADRLEIRLPERGRNVFSTNILMFMSVSLLFGSLLGLTIGFAPIFLLLLPVFTQTDLSFDRNTFKVRYLLFGRCYRERKGKTAAIQAVIDSQNSRITIKASHQNFTTNALAATEREWLIQEIQDWLQQGKQ